MALSVVIEKENESGSFINLKELLDNNSFEIEVKGRASTVKEGIHLIKTLKPDLLFLDIELDDGLGFEVLEQFPNPTFEVIFITAFDNYYKQAFEHFAFAYIEKPFHTSTLERVLNRFFLKEIKPLQKTKELLSYLDKTNASILVQSGNIHHLFLLEEIIFLKAEVNYTTFFLTKQRKVLANKGLIYYQKLLKGKGFFKANRSVLLNISHIKSIYKKEMIILRNKEKITVSVRNRAHLSSLIETLK
ncbi:LytTR family DNA-binding domain-containing protein [Flavobacteriaceae bacterium GF1]